MVAKAPHLSVHGSAGHPQDSFAAENANAEIHAVLFKRLEDAMCIVTSGCGVGRDVGYTAKPADGQTRCLASSFPWMNPKGAYALIS